MAKFKVGDRVRVVFNKLQPATVGKVGEVIKVYHDAEDNQALYKVRLDGRKTSSHCFGCAADIVPADTNEMDEFKIFAPKFLKQSGLPYDQYIDETNLKGSEWCHFGYKDRKGRQRRQNLITPDAKTYHPLGEK